jgi:hypothetical protein
VLRRKDNWPQWADAASPHNTDKRDHSEDPHAPYPTSLRCGSVLLCGTSSLPRARSCPLGWCRPALTGFGLLFLVFRLCSPRAAIRCRGGGVLVLCITSIGELGPRRTDLSGNPAQRYLRLLVNVAKKCRGRGPPFGALSQEGNAGLVRTVDWFDPERGLRDRGRAIRLPLHEGETGSPRPTPPTRCSPPNSDATPALGNLQDASARGGVAEELGLSRVRQLQRRAEDALRADGGELGPSRWVSPSPLTARDFWRISILT